MNLYYYDYKKYITFDYREPFLTTSRWKLAIGTNPCVRTRLNKKCTFCGFVDLPTPLPADQIAQIFEKTLEDHSIDEICRLELFMSGSFFDDVEVSAQSRQTIFEMLNNTPISEILIESRPEFLDHDKLKLLTKVIDPSRIAIAIGVETMSDQNRRYLSKGMPTKKILQGIENISKLGMTFQAYLLLKLPHFSDDKQAITGFLQDVQSLLQFTRKQPVNLIIAVQPLFIAHNTVAINLFKQGVLRPPWLYTIAFVLKCLKKLQKNDSFRIILGNEHDNIDLVAIPQNYTNPLHYEVCACSRAAKTQLHHINESTYSFDSIVESVLQISCHCQKLWYQEIEEVGHEGFLSKIAEF